MRGQAKRKHVFGIKDILVCGLEIVIGIIIYISSIYVFINMNKPVFVITTSSVVIQTLWDEIVNVATIAPVVGVFISNRVLIKINSNISELIRISWNILGVVIILFYRIAIALEFHPVIIACGGVVHFILCFIIMCFQSACKEIEVRVVDEGCLGKCIKSISNKHILGIQILTLKLVEEREYIAFDLKSIDWLVNEKADVNCILSTKLRLLREDYNFFQFVYRLYKEIVRTGSDEDKKAFLDSIDKAIDGIKTRLSHIDKENITRDDCCLARLLVCYMNLKKLVSNPSYAIIELNDGQLGIDAELERRLFTLFRTGLLGAILFGENQRYIFRYRRDGHKAGRKYCAFPISEFTKENDDVSTSEIICTIALRESTSYDIPYSVMECIQDYEDRILKYSERKEGK